MNILQNLSPISINLVEIFSSIQGETSFSGLPTTFIRLAGCNLRCSWCDTPYSFGKGSAASIDEIMKVVKDHGNKYVCVTGGEPLIQKNVYPLMKRLCDANFVVSIETGGSLPIESIDTRVITILDIKCPGSNMDHKNKLDNLKHIRPHDEVKFVIKNRNDYTFAIDLCKQFNLFDRKKDVLFAPVFDELEPKILVEWILEDKIPVRLNLQIHKFIWSPQMMGV